ncbi:MAG: Murein tetrapeptide carboxypeptidase [Rickettsiales bacterium]|jgi:muramoyltetrapeptide carboxypeptidase|nr:Murein tetrapeptide carboxypeptidase [Rickettsiales bacterium]
MIMAKNASNPPKRTRKPAAMTQKHYRKWPVLRKNDIIDIVAPGCGCTQEEIERSVECIKAMGLTPRIPHDITNPDAFPLCSNDDAYRFRHLKESLLAEDSKAVWCLRGGYGSARLIPDLAKVVAPEKAKLFIGFSDITALHLFLSQQWHWSTIHGPVLFQLGNGKVQAEMIREIEEIIFAREEKVLLTELEPMNALAVKDSAVYGSVTGGNLSVVQTSIGTTWQMQSKGKILFLEDVGERGYSVDRMLTHLSQSGLLEDIKALVFGDFIGGEEEDGISLCDTVLHRFVQEIGIPALRCKGVGHGKINHPLPFGTDVILKLGKKPTLTCQTGVAK